MSTLTSQTLVIEQRNLGLQVTFLTLLSFSLSFSLRSKGKGGREEQRQRPPFIGTAPNLGQGLCLYQCINPLTTTEESGYC